MQVSVFQPPDVIHPLESVIVVGDHKRCFALYLVENYIMEIGVGLYIEARRPETGRPEVLAD